MRLIAQPHRSSEAPVRTVGVDFRLIAPMVYKAELLVVKQVMTGLLQSVTAAECDVVLWLVKPRYRLFVSPLSKRVHDDQFCLVTKDVCSGQGTIVKCTVFGISVTFRCGQSDPRECANFTGFRELKNAIA